MSGISVLSGNPELEGTFVALYGKSMPIRRVWSSQWHDPAEAAIDAAAAAPELVVIGSDVPVDEMQEIVEELDRQFPSITTLCLLQAENAEITLQLLRSGAREVLTESQQPEAFRTNVDPVIALARERHGKTVSAEQTTLRRRVIAVVAPKGGSGKTTVATNLAVGLAKRSPKQVVLVDLDLQFGDSAPALGISPEYSTRDAIAGLTHQRSALKVFLASHPSGLAVLAPPDDLAEADDIDSDRIKDLLQALAEEFPFVVIDTSSGIDQSTLTAMELATDLLLVTATDVPAIRATRRLVEALDQIGYTSQRRSLLLNRANAKVGLGAREIEAAIGMEVNFEVPSTKLIPLSTNEGIPVIERDGNGTIGRKFDEVVRFFAPSQDDGSRWSLFRWKDG